VVCCRIEISVDVVDSGVSLSCIDGKPLSEGLAPPIRGIGEVLGT
jgi:hypothetical protein